MLQVIRTIALVALVVGVSAANSEVILVPAALAILGAVLLKISEVMDEEVDE